MHRTIDIWLGNPGGPVARSRDTAEAVAMGASVPVELSPELIEALQELLAQGLTEDEIRFKLR